MGWITIDEARENLKRWLDAERALSTGQSYTIGSRSLSRVNLAEVADRIDFWRNIIAGLEKDPTGTGSRGRVWRGVPRDL